MHKRQPVMCLVKDQHASKQGCGRWVYDVLYGQHVRHLGKEALLCSCIHAADEGFVGEGWILCIRFA